MGIEARFRIDYPGFVLDVDLALPGRGVTAVFGPSGCGKTTLLRAVAGLERATAGRLVVNGEAWQEGDFRLPTHRRPLGYVFQEANLFPHLSVRRNLDYGRSRVAAVEGRVDFDHVVELLGIGHLLDRLPAHLSGGERQRVAIARALLTSPRLLLMDEPLAALDLDRKGEILPYLERLHDQLDIPVLYVSHAPDEVARLADHLVVMQEGRAVACGPLTEVLARLDLPIRLGEDAGVVLEATVLARDEPWNLVQVEFPGGLLWVRDMGHAPGSRVRVRILARDVSVARGKNDSSILNTLPVTLRELAADGHPSQTLALLQAGDSSLLARMTRRSAAALGLAPGQSVWAQIKAVAVIG